MTDTDSVGVLGFWLVVLKHCNGALGRLITGYSEAFVITCRCTIHERLLGFRGVRTHHFGSCREIVSANTPAIIDTRLIACHALFLLPSLSLVVPTTPSHVAPAATSIFPFQ